MLRGYAGVFLAGGYIHVLNRLSVLDRLVFPFSPHFGWLTMTRPSTNRTHLADTENRRRFLRTALAGTGVALAVPQWTHGGQAVSSAGTAGQRFVEPVQDLPLCEDADVIVCGGGPAGIAAALTAARAGARTRLFEVNGCLGGVWTAGLLTFIFDFDKPGLSRELRDRLEDRGARRCQVPDQFVYEPEEMKLLVEDLCVEAHVKFQLHTRVAAAYCDQRRLRTVVTESKSGREAWRAPVFIDATGDGDLGAQAGCGWDIGHGGAECPCQPLTLNALAAVRDADALKDFISFYHVMDASDRKGKWAHHRKATTGLLAEIRRAGIDPSYGHPTLFQVRDNLLMVMVNHEYNVKAFDAAALSEATVRARAEVFQIVRALAKLGGPWAGMQVAATAEQIGIRDGRRIHGRYTLTREDLAGGRHEDAVTRATFGVDIHATDRETNKTTPISHGDVKFRPYDIPLRALIAKDVDGLLMAGRCISGDFLAHASYRVTGNSVATGEAAAAVAVLAAQSNRLPHEVTWKEAAALLEKVRQRA